MSDTPDEAEHDRMARNQALDWLGMLPDEKRLEVLAHFCSSCGREQDPDRRCQCWNDE